MSFQRMISHHNIGTLDDFCNFVNNNCSRYKHTTLTPTTIIKHYEFLKEKESEWLNGYGAKYSKLFLHELVTHNLDNSCALIPALFSQWLYNKKTPYNTFKIYDEICTLEWKDIDTDIAIHQRPIAYQTIPPLVCNSFTKRESPFKRNPLKGFWHKHHMQASFIMTNIILQNNKKKERHVLSETTKRLTAINLNTPNVISKLTKKFAHETTITAYENRATQGALTGEWIVYARHNRRNYYLTLASHNEPGENILKRINLCREDFPFLNKYPQFK